MSEENPNKTLTPLFQSKLDQFVDDVDRDRTCFFDEITQKPNFGGQVNTVIAEKGQPKTGPQIVLDQTFGRCLSMTDQTEAVGSINIPQGSGVEMTLACWVKCDPSKTGRVLLSNVGGSTHWALIMKERLEFVWLDTTRHYIEETQSWNRMTAEVATSATHWVHVAVVCSRTGKYKQELNLYLNGSLNQTTKDPRGEFEVIAAPNMIIGPSVEIAREVASLRKIYLYEPYEAPTLVLFQQDKDDLYLIVRGQTTQLGYDEDREHHSKELGQIARYDARTGTELNFTQTNIQRVYQAIFSPDGTYVEAGTRGLLVIDTQEMHLGSIGSDGVQKAHLGLNGPDGTSWPKPYRADENFVSNTYDNYCKGIATDGDGLWVAAAQQLMLWTTNNAGNYYDPVATSWDSYGPDQAPGRPTIVTFDHVRKAFWAATDRNTVTPQTHKRGFLYPWYVKVEEKNDEEKAFRLVFDVAVKAIICPMRAVTQPDFEGNLLACVILLENGQTHVYGWPEDRTGDTIPVEMKTGLSNLPAEFPKITHLSIDAAGHLLLIGTAHHFHLYDLHKNDFITSRQKGDNRTDDSADILNGCAISPDGSTMAIIWNEEAVEVWDVDHLADQPASLTAQLAGLRYYDFPLTQTDIEQVALGDLPATQVGTVFPLEFSLHNEKQQQALHLTEQPQDLFFEITNMGDVPIVVPNMAELDDSDLIVADRSAVELKFRPGTFREDGKELAKQIHLPTKDEVDATITEDSANWTLLREKDKDNNDILRLVHTGDDIPSRTLMAKESRTIRIMGFHVDSRRGTHATRVQLSYKLRSLDGTPMMGSRLHYMRVLNMDDAAMVGHINTLRSKSVTIFANLDKTDAKVSKLGAKLVAALKVERQLEDAQADLDNKLYFEHGGPLEAVIMGSNVVINDGLTMNTLVVRVRAARPYPVRISAKKDIANITLTLSNSYEPEWGVIDTQNVNQKITVTVLDQQEKWLELDQSAVVLPTAEPDPAVVAKLTEAIQASVEKDDSISNENKSSAATQQIAQMYKDQTKVAKQQQDIDAGEKKIVLNYQPTEGETLFTFVDVELSFICGETNGAGTGMRHIGVTYEGIGRMDGYVSPAKGWLSVAVQHARFQSSDTANTSAAPINMIDHAQLGFFKTADVKSADIRNLDPDKANSALWEDPDDIQGLAIASAAKIKMTPGLNPKDSKSKPTAPSLTLSIIKAKKKEDPKSKAAKDAPKTVDTLNAKLDGLLTAVGGLDAVDSSISGNSLTIAGKAVFAGDVQPAEDPNFPREGSYLVPRGAIIMWNGNINDVPTGWHLCDGTNDTPNMQQRFVVGVAGEVNTDPNLHPYARRETGGNTEKHRLTMKEMPLHDHEWHVDEKDHQHQILSFNNVNHKSDGNSWHVTTPDANLAKETLKTKGAKTGVDWDKALTAQGGTDKVEMRPPFIALCYIMKL